MSDEPRPNSVLNQVIDYLAHNGTIKVDILYETPFTLIAPGGPEDLFLDQDVDAIKTFDSVNATAIPA